MQLVRIIYPAVSPADVRAIVDAAWAARWREHDPGCDCQACASRIGYRRTRGLYRCAEPDRGALEDERTVQRGVPS